MKINQLPSPIGGEKRQSLLYLGFWELGNVLENSAFHTFVTHKLILQANTIKLAWLSGVKGACTSAEHVVFGGH